MAVSCRDDHRMVQCSLLLDGVLLLVVRVQDPLSRFVALTLVCGFEDCLKNCCVQCLW